MPTVLRRGHGEAVDGSSRSTLGQAVGENGRPDTVAVPRRVLHVGAASLVVLLAVGVGVSQLGGGREVAPTPAVSAAAQPSPVAPTPGAPAPAAPEAPRPSETPDGGTAAAGSAAFAGDPRPSQKHETARREREATRKGTHEHQREATPAAERERYKARGSGPAETGLQREDEVELLR